MVLRAVEPPLQELAPGLAAWSLGCGMDGEMAGLVHDVGGKAERCPSGRCTQSPSDGALRPGLVLRVSEAGAPVPGLTWGRRLLWVCL